MLAKLDRDQFEAALRDRGVTALARLLNQRVPHCYKGIFELKANKLTCEVLIDKLNEATPDELAVVPFEHGFCQFTFGEEIFRTTDARDESMLNGHKYQQVVLSYHGVQLLFRSGEIFGSLCHFDFEALSLSDDEFENLQLMARMMTLHLSAKGD